MSFELKDLKPRDADIVINNKKYDVKKFSMAAQIWCYYEFGNKENKNGLHILKEKLEDGDLHASAKVIYYLLKDKSDFVDIDDFIERAAKFKNLEAIYKTLCKVMGYSQPEIEKIEKEVELKKYSAATT